MPNILEAAINSLKAIIDDEPKAPLHIGEALTCWMHLTALAEAVAFEEAGLNMTTDAEVQRMLEDAIKMCNSQIKQLTDFMKQEGIPLPPVSEPKPKSEPTAVPMGVKLTDNELANGVALKVMSAITMCATGLVQAVRNDVGMMWFEFQTEHVIYGANLKALMRKRGWIKVPPYYFPPGLPNHN